MSYQTEGGNRHMLPFYRIVLVLGEFSVVAHDCPARASGIRTALLNRASAAYSPKARTTLARISLTGMRIRGHSCRYGSATPSAVTPPASVSIRNKRAQHGTLRYREACRARAEATSAPTTYRGPFSHFRGNKAKREEIIPLSPFRSIVHFIPQKNLL